VPSYTDADAVRIILARDLNQIDGTAASLTDEAIADAIAEAQARVDTRLSGQYDVPFTEPFPAMVMVITRDIAAWLAHLTFREVRDLTSELDPVHLRYKAAEALLIDLQNGKTTLPDAPGSDPGESGKASIVINETSSDLFTECDFNLTRRWPVWP
jgi:phage gp36-like protein